MSLYFSTLVQDFYLSEHCSPLDFKDALQEIINFDF